MIQPSKEEQEKNVRFHHYDYYFIYCNSLQLASLQEAYENMGLASKREEARMQKVDPKKAAQAERLGMGLGSRGGVSHSLFGEMKSIEQERPRNSASSTPFTSHRSPDIEDEFDTIIRFNTGPPKYNHSLLHYLFHI